MPGNPGCSTSVSLGKGKEPLRLSHYMIPRRVNSQTRCQLLTKKETASLWD